MPTNATERSVVIANRQVDFGARIQSQSEGRVRARQNRLSWNPLTWPRGMKDRYTEDAQRHRGINRLRRAANETNNPYTTIDRHTGQIDPHAHEAEAQEAVDAKLASIRAGNDAFGHGADTRAYKHIRAAQGPVRDVFANVLQGVVDGRLTDEHAVQQELAHIARENSRRRARRRNPAVANEVNEFFGRGANPTRQRAERFATDLLEVGEQIRDQYETPEDRQAAVQDTEIILANPTWAASTRAHHTVVDRTIRWIKERPVIGSMLNETTLGATASLVSFVGLRGVMGQAGRFASATGIGAAVGATIAGLERNRHLTSDRASHGAEVVEYGQHVPNNARIRGELDQYAPLAASVSDMLVGDGARDSALGHDTRSLQTLINEDLSVEDNRTALTNRLAEIRTRLLKSPRDKIGYINFTYGNDDAEHQVEQRRWLLERSLAEGRAALINALTPTDDDRYPTTAPEVATHTADALIGARADEWEAFLDRHQTAQDRAFRAYKARSVAFHAGRGALMGAGGAYVFGLIGHAILDHFRGGSSATIKPSKASVPSPVGIDGAKATIPQGTALVPGAHGTENLVVAGHHDQVLVKGLEVHKGTNGYSQLTWDHGTSKVPSSDIHLAQGDHAVTKHFKFPFQTTVNALSTHIKGIGWYHHTPPTSPNGNELGLHTVHQGNALILKPEGMGESTGSGLPPLNVPSAAGHGEVGYAIFLSGHKDPVIAYANGKNGALVLNPADHNSHDVIHLQGGRQVQEGLFSRGALKTRVLSHLPQGDVATQANGHENVFAIGGPDGQKGVISMGVLKNGKWDSIAAINGSGRPPATIDVPVTLHVPNAPVVHIDGNLIPGHPRTHEPFPPIVTVLKFRRQLEDTGGGYGRTYTDISPVRRTYDPDGLSHHFGLSSAGLPYGHPSGPISSGPWTRVRADDARAELSSVAADSSADKVSHAEHASRSTDHTPGQVYLSRAQERGISPEVAKRRYDSLMRIMQNSAELQLNNVLLHPTIRKQVLQLFAERFGNTIDNPEHVLAICFYALNQAGGLGADQDLAQELLTLASEYVSMTRTDNVALATSA
jgi:hypothetical protein